MAASAQFSLKSGCSLLVLLLLASVPSGQGEEAAEEPGQVAVITNENFAQVEEGEWMLEFYAPWCPACKQFASIWESFAAWAEHSESEVRVGKVDVTAESLLSGQFMVTHLPTVFHIKDGVVRMYQKQRLLSELTEYIEEELWREEDPISAWRSPMSYHMKIIGLTFWFSEKAKEIQVYLEQEYSIPTYGVFIIIAIGTIVIGLILGGITVCCIEICLRIYPRAPQKKILRQKPPAKEEDSGDTAAETKEDVGGEPVEEIDTPSESQGEESKPVTKGTSPRKRKGKKGKGSPARQD